MAKTHIHEITELSPNNINGDELLVVSNPNMSGYDTNKLSINQLKEFINLDGGGGGNNTTIISNGLVIYDTENENYAWGQTSNIVDEQYQVDCRFDILIKSGAPELYLDSKKIIIASFPGQTLLTYDDSSPASGTSTIQAYHTIDVKAGQIISLSGGTFTWSRIPLKSGGIFIDTEKLNVDSVYHDIDDTTNTTITISDYCLVNFTSPRRGMSYISSDNTNKYRVNGNYIPSPIPHHNVKIARGSNQGTATLCVIRGQAYLKPGDTSNIKGYYYPIL